MKEIREKQPDNEEKSINQLIATVLKYEPYLLALEVEKGDDYTYLLEKILKGDMTVESRLKELAESVEQEGIDLKVGQMEAERRLKGAMETDRTLSRDGAIRLLYDSGYIPQPWGVEEIPQPKKEGPQLQELLPEAIREKAIASIQNGVENYMRNIQGEIDSKIAAAEALSPKRPESPEAVNLSTFDLEDWDPNSNIVVVQEKPRPRITLDTGSDDNKPKFRLQ